MLSDTQDQKRLTMCDIRARTPAQIDVLSCRPRPLGAIITYRRPIEA